MKLPLIWTLFFCASAALAESPAMTEEQRERDYFTFSNDDDDKAPGSMYTTSGGCQAQRRPDIAEMWLQGLPIETLLSSIHSIKIAKSIEENDGVCTCELRYPLWDGAVNEVEDTFRDLADDESSAWVKDVRDEGSRASNYIRTQCRQYGVF